MRMKLSEWDGVQNHCTEASPAFEQHYDIIVAGLGTAGAVAAAVAAKSGMQVLGIEMNDLPGGTATGGHIYGYYHGIKGGFYRTMDDFAKKSRSGGYCNMRNPNDLSAYAKLHSIYIYHRRYGVQSVYGAAITGVYMEGSQVCGVRYTDEKGHHAVSARFVIDCTGNAVVCLSAGCTMQGGRAYDGRFQPYSNVQLRRTDTCQTILNIDSGYLNPYDPIAYGRAVIGSALAPHYLPQQNPQETCMLAASALLGIREGLRIVGEDTVSLKDWLAGRQTNEPIFFGCSNIDNHGKDTAFEDRTARDWATVCSMWGYSLTFPVPAGALIPKNVGGLLAAGRLLSVEHNMATALRMKDEMCKSGEAAAQLACLAIRHGCSANRVPYPALQTVLRSTGCLNTETHIRLGDTMQPPTEPPANTIWLTNPEQIYTQLGGDRPGYAIWSAAHAGDSILSLLETWLQDRNEKRRRNSALALGLAGSHKADEVLLRMAADQSGYIPKTSRKYNPLQAVSAISLCGRLGLRGACPLLFTIIAHSDYADKIPFTPDEFMQTKQEVYFQFFSHAMMALFEIGTQHPDLRPEILHRLQKRLWSPDCRLSVCLKAGNAQSYNILTQVQFMFTQLSNLW